MRPSKSFLLICLATLAVILLGYGLVRWKFGPVLPETIDKNLPNAVMVAGVGILLWNRKLRTDEEKAAAEKKRIEEAAAAAKQVMPLDALEPEGGAPDKEGQGGDGAGA